MMNHNDNDSNDANNNSNIYNDNNKNSDLSLGMKSKTVLGERFCYQNSQCLQGIIQITSYNVLLEKLQFYLIQTLWEIVWVFE